MDTPDAPAAPVADAAPAADATPAADPTPAAPNAGGAAPAADLFDDPNAASFPREYVQKLRDEAAGRRTALKPFEEAFDGYSDADRGALLDFTKLLRSDPAAAAAWMRQQADHLDTGQEPGEEDDGDEIDPDAPLTAAQLEKYLSDRDAKAKAEADQRASVDAIVTEAKALGYDPEKGRREYLALLDIASNETNGDLAKAAEIHKAERQKIIDDYLAGRQGVADAAPTTPGQASGGRQPFEAPKTWDDLKKFVRDGA